MFCKLQATANFGKEVVHLYQTTLLFSHLCLSAGRKASAGYLCWESWRSWGSAHPCLTAGQIQGGLMLQLHPALAKWHRPWTESSLNVLPLHLLWHLAPTNHFITDLQLQSMYRRMTSQQNGLVLDHRTEWTVLTYFCREKACNNTELKQKSSVSSSVYCRHYFRPQRANNTQASLKELTIVPTPWHWTYNFMPAGKVCQSQDRSSMDENPPLSTLQWKSETVLQKLDWWNLL